jgi:D-glycero-D-manno-heptose 1,7-bisphosphate phosphatase
MSIMAMFTIPRILKFIDGIFEVARVAHLGDRKLVVITNQAGIARGYYSEQKFHQLTAWMCNEFLNAGAPIGKFYFSPLHPTAGLGEYRKDDISRKPHPGMILLGQQKLNLDLGNSILIGDKASDIQAGIAAGVGINLLFSQQSLPELTSLPYQIIASLIEALSFLKNSCERTVTS